MILSSLYVLVLETGSDVALPVVLLSIWDGLHYLRTLTEFKFFDFAN